MIVSGTGETPRTLDELIDPGLAARLDRLDVISRKVFAGKMPGERRSKRRGQSVEFDDYREYAPGDDLRHLDWNVFARLDRFFVKLFREEEDLALHIMLDVSASMRAAAGPDGESKLVYAARLAMGLAYLGLVNQNRVGLGRFGMAGSARPIERLTPMRGRRHVERAARFVLDALRPPAAETGGPAPAAPFEESMAALASGVPGRGVLVLISDLLIPEGLERGLNYLAAGGAGGAGFDTCLLQVLTPGEIDPGADRDRGLVGDLRLTDIESGRAAEVTVSAAAIRAYRRRFEAHQAKIAEGCRKRGVRHVLVPTSTTVEDVLVGSLRRSRLVG